ncbi:carbohydrate-binding module family 1 protein non-catalytic module family cdh [Neofusicoccum parvum]|uniref:Carbohydrate-binding module family 1 protein non-catalytic module family cdh n=1 Tax=Neofusicoccum parvum TaxID=310453 RepID=A0ACB5RZN2_9PEZI|nr:carbohydrate-binding module family 1 protein non-catalytic module family cdh [Neofusicoccum parvum]GME65802.1 carbohydrate-binding module family 1 protein non-catalytic module family cdh [Neofusicoccum parvum]
MDSSMTLLNAHIQFLETQLALIHIPLHLYSNFLQPILQLLLPSSRPSSSGSSSTNGSNNQRSRKSWAYEHPFTNISVTPIECSIACSRELAEDLFTPVRDSLDPAYRDQVSITNEDYIVMQVDGEGLDAGQRVLELTSPLAMAGISIFFITTYFSDYILVPVRARGQVIKALEDRGFAFEQTTSSYVNPIANPLNTHTRNKSSSSSFDTLPPPPGTPPPASIHELQTRTFSLLKRRNIVFAVDPTIQLVQCAGSKDSASARPTSGGALNGSSLANRSHQPSLEDTLHLGLVKCLISAPRPTFLSLTLTDTEPASILLEKRLLPNFAPDVLLGSKEDVLVPITLDLRELPLESTGIVCGVAGRLVGGTRGMGAFDGEGSDAVEMSYLSTARAGTVMVGEEELERAMEALRGADDDVSVN